MPFSDPPPPKPRKLLIITSSGGGGLIQAANAKEQEARAKDPNIEVVRKDVLKDWMGNVFGKFCSEMWNGAQMKGDITALRFVIWAQFIFDYICWPYFFVRALLTLFKEEADQVIDTQPLGTSAILKALRIYNAKRNKQVRLQKVLVDLPTKAATHFFRPIKNLTKKDRPFLQLTTIAPLLDEGQTREQFWQTNCRLSEKEIHYEDVYVRQSFRKFQNKQRDAKEFPVFIRFKSEEELNLMRMTFEKGRFQGIVKNDEVHFSVAPTDRLITILLGSQPASESTFNYVKKFLKLGLEGKSPNNRCRLFVFSSEHKPHSQSLFRKIAEYVRGLDKYPQNFSIIPFSFQSDDVIAPLFFRSDLTCTRSGGQTAMELMCVSSGDMWIHSETKKDPNQKEDLCLKQLLDGIPGWEAANALYMKKIRNARIVTPETIDSLAATFFASGSKRDQSIAALIQAF